MSLVSEERVGGRAGTAAPQGAVCELPNPPSFPYRFPHQFKHLAPFRPPPPTEGRRWNGRRLACIRILGICDNSSIRIDFKRLSFYYEIL
jgi:hypothetical protein